MKQGKRSQAAAKTLPEAKLSSEQRNKLSFLDQIQAKHCKCPLREFDNHKRPEALRNDVSPFRSGRSDVSENGFPRYGDLQPILEKTVLYKDEENNFVISEESMHKLFAGMARPD